MGLFTTSTSPEIPWGLPRRVGRLKTDSATSMTPSNREVPPVSTEPDQGASGLAVVSSISREIPEAHTTCGLSNVSFGLPGRSILNAAYLAMMMRAGLDSAIIDPLNEQIMDSLRAARALLGQDEMCMEYIQAARAK